MDKYNKIAREIIALIGEDNIISVTHCATRLRVMVKDRDLIDDKKMEKVDEVKGVFFTSGQYQIILGTGIVNKVYAEVENIGVKTLSKKVIIRKEQHRQSHKVHHLYHQLHH